MRTSLQIGLLMALASIAACGDESGETPTQVIVLVDAEREVRAATMQLHVTVRDDGREEAFDRKVPANWPLKLALVPRDGDASRTYHVTAEAIDGAGDVVAVARLQSGYVAAQKRFVVLLLEADCLGKSCMGATQTCHAGQCWNAELAPELFGTTQDGAPKTSVLASTTGRSPGGGDPDSGLGGLGGSTGAGGSTPAGAGGDGRDETSAGRGGDTPSDDAGSGGTSGTGVEPIDSGAEDGAAGSGSPDGGATHDPCTIDNGGCDPLVTCSSDGAQVTCAECPEGYRDNVSRCTLVDCGSLSATSPLSVSLPEGSRYGQIAAYSCAQGYTLTGSATRTCQTDGSWSASMPACVDQDACLSSSVCPAVYPCQDRPAPSLDYTCRGQYADWPPSDATSHLIPNADGTVSDPRGGLIWKQSLEPSAVWFAAITACGDLTFAGANDWRLPTKAELESIVDYTRHGPAISIAAFPGTNGGRFWTSSAVAGVDQTAWVVIFQYGDTDPNPTNEACGVRCVRSVVPATASTGAGGAPPGRYAVNPDGTVLDTRTHLLWQRSIDGNAHTRASATAYCQSLALASRSWRLPLISELLTLVDPTRANPAIDTVAFPGATSDQFWASSPFSFFSSMYGWLVRFSDGYSVDGPLGNAHRVRCVAVDAAR